jgi:predicted  nucleic acid-binding Zn-ribbon protein
MHWTTAKLIALEQAEKTLAHGRAGHSQFKFTQLTTALRSEIPPHLAFAYDQLKREHKEPVVGVSREKCEGCNAAPSPPALARLREEHEASQCEQCGRFIYLATGHDLAPSCRHHQPAGGLPVS